MALTVLSLAVYLLFVGRLVEGYWDSQMPCTMEIIQRDEIKSSITTIHLTNLDLMRPGSANHAR